jgi:phospholipid/cholesterol/gamma-HCH transport system substrate-binding protein
MKGKILETFLGAIVLGIAALLLGYGYLRETKSDVEGYPLFVRFEKADGLVVGSDVKVSGIKVGRVETLSMDNDTFEAVAKLMVKEGILLPKDTSAAIVSESLLGGKYLALTPGGDEENLKSGGEIRRAQSSIVLESLLSQMVFNNKDDKKKDHGDD